MGSVLDVPISPTRKYVSGWIGIGIFALLYAALYAGNLWLPLNGSNYTTRIWIWSEMALAVLALVVLIQKRHMITPGSSLLGLALAVLSAISFAINNPGPWGGLLEAIAVWLCFQGGVVLFKDLEAPGIPAFRPPLAKVGHSLLFGAAAAVPLVVINNLYFYLTSGAIHLKNAFDSAFEALSPGISEEIVFRFFILAVCLNLFKAGEPPRFMMPVAIVLAVVPHSLNHLPDLFLENPFLGFGMLAATSLLFGLPMALLQIRRNLETAIAFHWFIDFARFLFGF